MLPDLLITALTVQQEEGITGHSLRRVTGWEYGLYPSYAYRWLDNVHMLLFAFAGEEHYDEMSGPTRIFQPAVVNLESGQVWFPVRNRVSDWDHHPLLWSAALQVLIVAQDEEILLLNTTGEVMQRFPGDVPLSLSPSGKRLLAGAIWRDLETGRTMDFGDLRMIYPDWSANETRLIGSARFANAQSGQYDYSNPQGVHLAGRGGGGIIKERWVLDDTRMMIEWDCDDGESPIVPLIDPQTRTYQDLCDVAKLPNDPTGCYWGVQPRVAPNGEYAIVGDYLVDLRTFVALSPPDDLHPAGWSPDSRFVVLSRDWNTETQSAEYSLLSLIDRSIRLVSDTPVVWMRWNAQSDHLAFLSETRRELIILAVETWTSHRVSLPHTGIRVFWRPQEDALAILADDGSLWRLATLDSGTVDPLTPPFVDMRDIQWSPDGASIAFVAGTDVYIVSVGIPDDH